MTYVVPCKVARRRADNVDTKAGRRAIVSFHGSEKSAESVGGGLLEPVLFHRPQQGWLRPVVQSRREAAPSTPSPFSSSLLLPTPPFSILLPLSASLPSFPQCIQMGNSHCASVVRSAVARKGGAGNALTLNTARGLRVFATARFFKSVAHLTEMGFEAHTFDGTLLLWRASKL